jgi:hypothetical protein
MIIMDKSHASHAISHAVFAREQVTGAALFVLINTIIKACMLAIILDILSAPLVIKTANYVLDQIRIIALLVLVLAHRCS